MSTGAELFAAFFRAHHDDVRRYLQRRLGSRDDAEELAADVFRIAWQKFDGGDASRAWAFGVARNVLLDHRRRTGRREAAVGRLRDEAAVRTGHADEPLEHPVLEALARLPESLQEMLRLRYWEGLEPAEIAIVQGISAGNARVRLHRAHARLRALLPAASDDRATGGGSAPSWSGPATRGAES